MEKFINIINNLRKESGKTQAQVAVDLGMSAQKYSYMIKNDREPDYEILSKIADYFNVSVDYLLGKSPYKLPQNVDLKLEGFEALNANLNGCGGLGPADLINALNRLLGVTLSNLKSDGIDIDAVVLSDIASAIQKWCDIIETAASVILKATPYSNDNADTVKYKIYIAGENIKNIVVQDGDIVIKRLQQDNQNNKNEGETNGDST
jgi:transcriptional regulator with XRE-family HTH domain